MESYVGSVKRDAVNRSLESAFLHIQAATSEDPLESKLAPILRS